MGLGLFLLGRGMNAAQRDAAVRAKRDAALELADRAAWLERVVDGTVLGHPRVRAVVDDGHWGEEIAWTYTWTQWVSLAGGVTAGAVALFGGAFGYEVATGRSFAASDAVFVVSAAAFLAFLVTVWTTQAWLRRRFLRRVDAGFAKQGWDVPKLRAQMAAHAERVAEEQREANRLRRDGRDPRLFPRP